MSVLGALRDKLISPAGLAFARKMTAELLGDLPRTATETSPSARAACAGPTSASRASCASSSRATRPRRSLNGGDLTAQAEAVRAAIDAIRRDPAEPVRLPAPAGLLGRVLDLERRVADDPLVGREELRQLLSGAHLRLEPECCTSRRRPGRPRMRRRPSRTASDACSCWRTGPGPSSREAHDRYARHIDARVAKTADRAPDTRRRASRVGRAGSDR